MRVPDGAPQPTRNVTGSFNNSNNNNNSNIINNDKSVPMEDRISQIQDYIRITTSLIDSINAEKVGDWANNCASNCILVYCVDAMTSNPYL